MGTRLINARAETVHTKPSFSTHSAHGSAWCQLTGGSSGNGRGPASSPTFWPSRTDRRCHLPLYGSAGARMENPLESFTTITAAAFLALIDIHQP